MSWLRGQIQKAESRIEHHLQFQQGKCPYAARRRLRSNGRIEQEHGVPTPQNQTLFQAFEWHTPGKHWQRLSSVLPSLAEIGITSLWIPPGCKANSPKGNGYDCYDLWDLGEFDQKWTRSTKWGSRAELQALMASAKSMDVAIIWDAVLNHKTAGDAKEECWAVEVDPGGTSCIHLHFDGCRGRRQLSLS